MRGMSVMIAAAGLALFGCSTKHRPDDGAAGGDGALAGMISTAPPPFDLPGSGGVTGGAGLGAAAGASGTTPAGAGGAGGASGATATNAGAGGMSGASGQGGLGGSAGASAGRGGSSGAGGSAGIVSSDGPLHFGPNIRINDDSGNMPQNEIVLATSNGVLVAGWNDGRASNGRAGYSCGYSVSRDAGMTWSANIFAKTTGQTQSGSFDGDPGVAADDAGNLYLSCEDYGSQQIVFARSPDAGATFTPWRNVQAAPDKPWTAAARDGTVFQTWLGRPGGYHRSLDHGDSWEPVISLGNLSRGTGIASGSSGFVHIPYATDGGQVHYVRSEDWGQTLEPGRDLSSLGTLACQANCEPRSLPIIGCAADPSGQTVAITWASTLSGGDGDDDVWVLISKDGGETWSKRLRANDNQQASRQFQPWTAVDASGRVHVTWTDLRNAGMNSVYYASVLDPAKGFGANVEVTDDRGDATTFLGDYKGIVLQGAYVVIAWTDTRRGNPDIYVARAKLDGSLP